MSLLSQRMQCSTTHLVVLCDLYSLAAATAKFPHARKHNGRGAMNQTRTH